MLEIIIVLIFIITKSNSFCKLIPTLNMNDLVILSCNSKLDNNNMNTNRIGYVDEMMNIHPLGIKSDDDEESEEYTILYYDEDSPITTVDDSSDAIISILDDNMYTIEQRAIQDRISNPHGEHSEDVFILSKEALESININNKISLYLPEIEGH